LARKALQGTDRRFMPAGGKRERACTVDKCGFLTRSRRTPGTDSRVIRFVFATSDICRDGDRIMPGAWDLER
jgi:hypothetical protein